MNILDKIVRHKKEEVEQKKEKTPLGQLRFEFMNANYKHASLIDRFLTNGDFHFICEVKKASPSAGIIKSDFDPVDQALEYFKGGASAVSVLTDERFFQGNLNYLRMIKKTLPIPVLRKDFIIDTYQIMESAVAGADIILLIARILTRDQLKIFTLLAARLGMEVLIELNDPEELDKLPLNVVDLPVILGINNRDLSTFEVSLDNSLRMLPDLPGGIPVISESGIRSHRDCKLLKDNGFHGALIGEGLMRQENPSAYLNKLREATNGIHPS
ncbi:MAG: indole-3-glycerol phosphate synthase TrpC [Calditrichaeota bacterium]|nr:indole-3-glycerol phosphate synthase TrpC [Calditrichota bacterium]